MTVDVPESVARLLPADPERRAQSVLEGLVIGAYTQGVISRGRACELLGLDYWQGERFFSQRGVFVNYDLQEFQNDLGN
jgi:predicted HTH domain antitoxin